MPNQEDPRSNRHAPGRGGDVPIEYQPESGQPGVTRDPVPGAPEPDDPPTTTRRTLNDEKDDD
jgi:hypothetical protein